MAVHGRIFFYKRETNSRTEINQRECILTVCLRDSRSVCILEASICNLFKFPGFHDDTLLTERKEEEEEMAITTLAVREGRNIILPK